MFERIAQLEKSIKCSVRALCRTDDGAVDETKKAMWSILLREDSCCSCAYAKAVLSLRNCRAAWVVCSFALSGRPILFFFFFFRWKSQPECQPSSEPRNAESDCTKSH